MPVSPVLIGVDWGTSSLRAYLIDQEGNVVDTLSSNEGILNIQDDDFEAVFERFVGEWLRLYPLLPIILSGMITSRNGWVEVDYLPLPAGMQGIASAITIHETRLGRRLHFVPGLATASRVSIPDVMRGEETELIGQIYQYGGDGTFLLPGTHSKWVTVKDSKIIELQTFMTGEVYALLKYKSILSKLLVEAVSFKSFAKGVTYRASNSGSILNQLFSVRTLPLFELMPKEEVSDYLSGLLIAEEIRGALESRKGPQDIKIIGQGDLAERYCYALKLMGVSTIVVEQGMVARGHFELALQQGLVHDKF